MALPIPPTSVWLKMFHRGQIGQAKLVIECSRCGKIASGRRMRRTRCPKCKSSVDDDLVVRRILVYELVEGRQRRLSSEEMEKNFGAFCQKLGQLNHGV